MTLALGLLLAYCALQVALGFWVSRRVRTSADFFVAGRSLGPGLLFATFVAANIGAGSTVGATGLGYRDGFAAWWWVGSAAIGSLVLAFTVGPRMRRVAAENGLKTVGDYLEHRYSRGLRGAVAALLWIGTLAILSGQLIALAFILNVVAGLPKWLGCVAGGTVVVLYFTAGGLLTSASVNVVQATVKIVGFAVALTVVLARTGGPSTWAVDGPDRWGFFQAGGSGIGFLAILGPAFIVSPGLLQKIFGARDDRAVRLGVGGNAALLFAFAFVPPLLGMAARSLHPDLANAELALPTLFMSDLPVLLGAIGLAAVVSAELSAADAILFMLSTSLSQDLYRRFLDPQASDRRVLTVARAAAILGGAMGVALAIVAPSVIGVLSVFYTILSVCLFVPILAGLYVSKAGSREAGISMAAGFAVLLGAQLAGGRGLAGLDPGVLGLLASAFAFAVAMAGRTIRGPREASQ